jgi:7,8-dihydropterin-6-yl-methyl-4-(beta-D-ribofuranosyl)aminobenzene 5'-phosphate synthase
MVVEDEGCLVVFTGCAHNGILNMVATVLHHYPGRTITALFGGFHLSGIPTDHHHPEGRAEVVSVAETIAAFPIEQIYASHCTGSCAFTILKERLGDRIDPFPVGSVWNHRPADTTGVS